MTAFLIINYGGIEGIMANLDSQNDRVAIIYTPINQSLRVREEERFADEEEQEVAVYVKEALALAGRSADILCLDLDHLEKLAGYAGVFNLVENYSGCDPNLESNFARRLQELGLPFTGPGALTLKTCLNKAETKARMVHAFVIGLLLRAKIFNDLKILRLADEGVFALIGAGAAIGTKGRKGNTAR